MIAARERRADPVRDPPLRALRREQHRSGRARLQGGKEGLLTGAIVDERHALLGERRARECGDARHHCGPVPRRVLQREGAHARARRGEELGSARQRRIRGGVIDLTRVSEPTRP